MSLLRSVLAALVFALCLFGDGASCHEYTDDQFVDYEIVKPELVRQQSGADMILKCNITSSHHKHKVVWEFKACRTSSKRVSCCEYLKRLNLSSDDDEEAWSRLMTERIVKKKFSSNLHLDSIGENRSGIYRCMDGNRRLVKAFQVEVVGSGDGYAASPPEVLDLNVTVFPDNDQVIIRCVVRSSQPPAVWWLRESDSGDHDFIYLGKFYKRVTDTAGGTPPQVHPMPGETDVYASKLGASVSVSGVYVCVAVTEGGKDFRRASLGTPTAVLSTAKTAFAPGGASSLSAAAEKRTTPVFLLFLIPVAFALLPITVWLCYYRKRRRKTIAKVVCNGTDNQLTRPIISVSNDFCVKT